MPNLSDSKLYQFILNKIAALETKTNSSAAPGGTGGEANNASNIGTGAGVFKDKLGVNLNFRSIKQGANITVQENADDITISGTGGAGGTGGEVNTAANVGTGAGVFKDKTGVNINVRSIKQGANITVQENADDITISGTGGAGGANYRSSATTLTAIAAIATPLVYVIDSDVVVSTTVTTNKNTTLVFETGGKFTQSVGANLTIKGEIVAPPTKLFFGFNKDNLLLEHRGRFYFEWLGAIGDATADDTIPIQLALDCVRKYSTHFDWQGGWFSVEQRFRHTAQFVINYPSKISGTHKKTCGFEPDANVSTFRVNHKETEDIVKPFYRSGEGTIIENCGFRAADSDFNLTKTHVVNLTSAILTAASPPLTDQNAAFNGRWEIKLKRVTGDAAAIANKVFEGNTVTFNGWDWLIRLQALDGVVLYPYSLYSTKVADRKIQMLYPVTTTAQATLLVGAKVHCPADDTIRTITAAQNVATGSGQALEFTFDATDPILPGNLNSNQECSVVALPTQNNLDVRFNMFPAIDGRARIRVINCYMAGYNGEAVLMNSVIPPTTNANVAPNTNNSYVDIEAENNRGAAMMCYGLNANHIDIRLNTTNNAATCYLSGYLGVHVLFLHALFDRQGAFIGVNGTGGNHPFGCLVDFGYVEGGSPLPKIAQTIWMGGDIGEGGNQFSKNFYGAPYPSFTTPSHLRATTDGIALNSFFKAELLQIAATGGRPPAIVDYEGMLWIDKSVAPSKLQVLLKNTNGTFGWVNVGSGI